MEETEVQRYDAHLTDAEREACARAGFTCLSDAVPAEGQWVQVVCDVRSEPDNLAHRLAIRGVIDPPAPRVTHARMRGVTRDGYAVLDCGSRAYARTVAYPTHWRAMEPLPYAVPPELLPAPKPGRAACSDG